MTFRVEITSEAEKDLLRIGDWISEKSPESARRWTFSAWNAIRSLESGALGCSLAPENEHVSEEVRNIFFRTRRGRTYRALFFIVDEVVTVTHIRGPGQDILSPDELNAPD